MSTRQKQKQKAIAVIPARYGSTRFPGKVLAQLCGKPMVQWVYETAAASLANEVIVATDDARVVDAVEAFGGKAVMTSPDHGSGTDRVYEAIAGLPHDIVINLQGDEPLLPVQIINDLITNLRQHPEIDMGTVAVPAERSLLNDPNRVKVVFDNQGFALYFSRSLIPFLREGGEETTLYLHWGIYAFRRRAIERFVVLPPGRLESCEKLEQLRALENGIRIHVMTTSEGSVGVDTPQDLLAAEARLKEINNH